MTGSTAATVLEAARASARDKRSVGDEQQAAQPVATHLLCLLCMLAQPPRFGLRGTRWPVHMRAHNLQHSMPGAILQGQQHG